MKISPFLVAVLVALSIMACGYTIGPKGVMLLDEKDSGKTIDLKVGDQIELSLAGNPTTGYIWDFSPYFIPTLKPTGGFQFKPSSKALGAGGRFTWNFRAAKAGKVKLTLDYKRRWEKKPPAKHFSVDIVIK